MRRNNSGVVSAGLSTLLVVNAFLAAGTLAGCEANPARPIIASGNNSVVTGVDADLSDPFGSCEVGTTDSPFFPLVCSRAHGLCTGGGEGITCTPTTCTPSVYHVFCEHPCSVDADCPVPLTGTARPSCNTDFHFCRLDCSGNRDCPIGSTCQDGTPWLARDSAGNSLGLPQMCMQTITIDIKPDGGR